MRHLDNKGQGMSIGVIVGIVLALVFLVVVLSFVGVIKTEILNLDTVSQTGCWTTNTLRCGGGVFASWPSLCQINTNDKTNQEELARMLRDSWWTFKQGECDYSNAGDEIFQTYAFIPEEDIVISDFLDYLQTHNKGRGITDITKSDYNYLQAGTSVNTLCFDTADKEGIANNKLAKGETYYIIYYDDAGILGTELGYQSDSIIISRDPFFDKNYYQKILRDSAYVFAPALAATIAGVVTIANPPSLLPVATIGTYQGISYVIQTPVEEGCLVYGPI